MAPAYFHITTGASAEQKGKNRPFQVRGDQEMPAFDLARFLLSC
jgi:hypothetical protein